LVAKIDGKDLLDHVGRPIFRVQGIIFRNYSSESEVVHPIDPELARRMRTKADGAFSAFGVARSPIAPALAVDLAKAKTLEAHRGSDLRGHTRKSKLRLDRNHR
jgi:hypothetical protein